MSKLEQALARLTTACVEVSKILDLGKRDPNWAETQELENAALDYGRAIRAAGKPKRSTTVTTTTSHAKAGR